ncbi:hypothetical protein [Patulibacter sp.]|uniref:hypothetical protein n=1 Tax=Patulibacter sp. TaxID=1912859 RepID=UPI00272714B1|nr:hypothetical protein [Patulibacter sp.]MDO9409180.1 hypothetical protein [Patulibacter sp.]
MSPKYDAFGRPVEPEAPRPSTLGRPGERSTRDPRAAEHRSFGSPSAPWTPATRKDDAVVPEVRGLPSVTGGRPVGARAGKRVQGLTRLAGGVGAVVLVLLAIVGSLVDDDAPTASSGGRVGIVGTTPLTAERVARAVGLLRVEMGSGERVLSVSITDSYASARVLTADGDGTRSLSLGRDGAVTAVGGSSTSATSRGVPVTDLDAPAAGAIAEAVVRGLGPGATGALRSLTAYSYQDEPLRWTASVEGGPDVSRTWSADQAGRSVVRTKDGAPAPPKGQPGPATVPEGISGTSLLAPDNLRQALGALGALPALQDESPREILLSTLNLEPERLLAGVKDGTDRRLVSVDAAFGLDPSAVSPSAGEDTVALSDVDAAGPARALRTIGRRLSTDAAAQVQSVSLAPDGGAADGGRPGWFVLLEGEGEDRVWRASLDGRRVGRSGEDLTR